tara:strand:+ start:619 stop:1023 length:405 start_codon:yes stop_codon:yes gene_type:complete
MDKCTYVKKLYIYENINSLCNHSQIINLVDENNIKYTENNNGIFINISLLDSTIIDQMYDIIYNAQNYDESNNQYNNNIIIKDNGIEGVTPDKVMDKEEDKYAKKKEINTNTLNDFDLSEFEKKIVLESKKYTL